MIARRAERADWAPRAAILWMLRVTAGHALVTLWLRMSVGTKYSADSQARSCCHLATISTTHAALKHSIPLMDRRRRSHVNRVLSLGTKTGC